LLSSPTDLALHLMKVRCLLDLGQSAQATQACCAALEAHPGNAQLWEWLAGLVAPEQSLAVLRQGYLASGQPALLHRLAQGLHAEGKYTETIALLESRPEDAVTAELLKRCKHDLHWQRFQAQAQIRELLKKEQWLEALELARSINDGELVSSALEKLGRYAEAAHALDGMEPVTTYALKAGRLLAKAGADSEAIDQYEKVLRTGQRDNQFWQELDQVARLNGEPTSAVFQHDCGALVYLDPARLAFGCTQCQTQAGLDLEKLTVSTRARWPEFWAGGVQAAFQASVLWPIAERCSGVVDRETVLQQLEQSFLEHPEAKKLEKRFSSKSRTVWGFFSAANPIVNSPAPSHGDLELRLQLEITPEMVPVLKGPVQVRVFGSPEAEAWSEPVYAATATEVTGGGQSSVLLQPVTQPPDPSALASGARDQESESILLCASMMLARRLEHPYFRQPWMAAPSFVGGVPDWMQSPLSKRCPKCQTKMAFLAQISSDVCCDGHLKLESWPGRCLYLFLCPHDLTVELESQC
jgi:tetratricopeptide (TPR) repeat protein